MFINHSKYTIIVLTLLLTIFGCGGGGGSSDSSKPGENLIVDFSYPNQVLWQLSAFDLAPNCQGSLSGKSAHYSITSGTLPSGVILDSSTGHIKGISDVLGTFPVKIKLTVDGYQGTLYYDKSIYIVEPSIHYACLLPAKYYTMGFNGNEMIAGLSGTTIRISSINNPAATINYSIIGDIPLPPGLTLDHSTGIINGTCNTPSINLVNIRVDIAYKATHKTIEGLIPIVVLPVIRLTNNQPTSPVDVAYRAPTGYTISTQFAYSGSSYDFQLLPDNKGFSILYPGIYSGTTYYCLKGDNSALISITPGLPNSSFRAIDPILLANGELP